MIKAGELREKIQIMDSQRVANNSGGGTFTDLPLLDTFARVREIESDLSLVASQDNIRQLVEFMIRFRTDLEIVNGQTILWRGFKYKVHSLKVDALRTEIKIVAFQVMDSSKRTSQDAPIPDNDTFDTTFDATFK